VWRESSFSSARAAACVSSFRTPVISSPRTVDPSLRHRFYPQATSHFLESEKPWLKWTHTFLVCYFQALNLLCKMERSMALGSMALGWGRGVGAVSSLFVTVSPRCLTDSQVSSSGCSGPRCCMSCRCTALLGKPGRVELAGPCRPWGRRQGQTVWGVVWIGPTIKTNCF
jgi:hypothetical protein